MRTTLTLDADVARLVEDAVHRERRPMKQVVNDALRKALSAPEVRSKPYRVQEHESALRPGIDLSGFNRLADEMEDDQIVATTRKTT
jgi:hypothetical protein